jgi:hypothetical protein
LSRSHPVYDGSADAVQFAVLKGHPSIGAADFVIV